MANSVVRTAFGRRSAVIGLAPVRVLNAVLSTPFSAAAELRTMKAPDHQCLCSQAGISDISPTARTVLAAPKAGNREGHFEPAEPSMVAASDDGRSSPIRTMTTRFVTEPQAWGGQFVGGIPRIGLRLKTR